MLPQLGDGTNVQKATPGSTNVMTNAAAVRTGPAATHVCALVNSGNLYGWGLGVSGQVRRIFFCVLCNQSLAKAAYLYVRALLSALLLPYCDRCGL